MKSLIFVVLTLMTLSVKIGLIGMAITTVIAFLLFFAAGVSMGVITPFFMPWAVLLLIGLSNRNKTNK